jgi:predicted alpha/beta hydrolase family esterase
MPSAAASTPPTVLVLPGYGDSGPQHWQSRWEAADPRLRRVQQRDWLEPRLDDWLGALDRAIAACATPPVLVAHSLACAMVAHWVQRAPGRAVRAALLVAPPDVEALARVLEAVQTFCPVPLVRLPFPTIVVASDDDLYVTSERAQAYARAWGSRFVPLSGAGHINADSGFGEWAEGRALLDELAGTG